MGGYGALKIAMKHPEMFGSVSAHSAALVPDFDSTTVTGRRLDQFKMLVRPYLWDQFCRHAGPFLLGRQQSTGAGEKYRASLPEMKIYFDCGTEDDYGFYDGHKVLDDMLTKASYPHEAHLYPGNHGWDYAKQHTQQSLLFHGKAFSSKVGDRTHARVPMLRSRPGDQQRQMSLTEHSRIDPWSNPMDVSFTVVPYDSPDFLEHVLPAIPKGSAVYKIFDTRGQLIVLDKTGNLSQRLERFFGPRSEFVKDLDLRTITSRIEYRPHLFAVRNAYLLYLERRGCFPKTIERCGLSRFSR